MIDLIANGFLIISWVLIVVGLFGINKFESLYAKLLTSSKIDTAAVMLILVALIMKSGISKNSLKLFIILIFLLLTSPISNHLIAISAHFNGVEVEEEEDGF